MRSGSQPEHLNLRAPGRTLRPRGSRSVGEAFHFVLVGAKQHRSILHRVHLSLCHCLPRTARPSSTHNSIFIVWIEILAVANLFLLLFETEIDCKKRFTYNRLKKNASLKARAIEQHLDNIWSLNIILLAQYPAEKAFFSLLDCNPIFPPELAKRSWKQPTAHAI